MFLMIVGASGREGSKRKISPSAGFGAKPTEPETIASITASPSARAVASTVPATIAGRAVRTPIFQIVRQRLTPRRERALDPARAAPPAGRRRRSTIMIGAIITVRISIAASRL